MNVGHVLASFLLLWIVGIEQSASTATSSWENSSTDEILTEPETASVSVYESSGEMQDATTMQRSATSYMQPMNPNSTVAYTLMSDTTVYTDMNVMTTEDIESAAEGSGEYEITENATYSATVFSTSVLDNTSPSVEFETEAIAASTTYVDATGTTEMNQNFEKYSYTFDSGNMTVGSTAYTWGRVEKETTESSETSPRDQTASSFATTMGKQNTEQSTTTTEVTTTSFGTEGARTATSAEAHAPLDARTGDATVPAYFSETTVAYDINTALSKSTYGSSESTYESSGSTYGSSETTYESYTSSSPSLFSNDNTTVENSPHASVTLRSDFESTVSEQTAVQDTATTTSSLADTTGGLPTTSNVQQTISFTQPINSTSTNENSLQSTVAHTMTTAESPGTAKFAGVDKTTSYSSTSVTDMSTFASQADKNSSDLTQTLTNTKKSDYSTISSTSFQASESKTELLPTSNSTTGSMTSSSYSLFSSGSETTARDNPSTSSSTSLRAVFPEATTSELATFSSSGFEETQSASNRPIDLSETVSTTLMKTTSAPETTSNFVESATDATAKTFVTTTYSTSVQRTSKAEMTDGQSNSASTASALETSASEAISTAEKATTVSSPSESSGPATASENTVTDFSIDTTTPLRTATFVTNSEPTHQATAQPSKNPYLATSPLLSTLEASTGEEAVTTENALATNTIFSTSIHIMTAELGSGAITTVRPTTPSATFASSGTEGSSESHANSSVLADQSPSQTVFNDFTSSVVSSDVSAVTESSSPSSALVSVTDSSGTSREMSVRETTSQLTETSEGTTDQQSPLASTATTSQQNPLALTATDGQQSTLASTETTSQQSTLGSTVTDDQQSPLASTETTSQQSTLGSTATDGQQSTLASTATTSQQSTLGSTVTDDQQSPLASTATDGQQSTLVSTATTSQQSSLTSTVTNDQQSTLGSTVTDGQQSPLVSTATDGQQSTLVSTATDGQQTTRFSTATNGQQSSLTSTATDGQQSTLASTATDGQQSTLVSTATTSQQSSLTSTATDGQQSPLGSTATDGQQSPLASTATDGQQSTLALTATTSQQSPLVSTATDGQQSPFVSTATTSQQSSLGSTVTDGQQSPLVSTATTSQQSSLVSTATDGQQSTPGSTATNGQQNPLVITATDGQQSSLTSTATDDQQSTLVSTATTSQQSSLTSMATDDQQSTLASTATNGQQSSLASTATTSQQSTLVSMATDGQQSTLGSTATDGQQSTPGSTATNGQQNPLVITATDGQQSSLTSTATTSQQSSLVSMATDGQQSTLGSTATDDQQSPLVSTATTNQQSSLASTATTSQQSSLVSMATDGQQSTLGSTATDDQQSPLVSTATTSQQSSLTSTATDDQQSPFVSTATNGQQTSLASTATNGQQNSLASTATTSQQSPLASTTNDGQQSTYGPSTTVTTFQQVTEVSSLLPTTTAHIATITTSSTASKFETTPTTTSSRATTTQMTTPVKTTSTATISTDQGVTSSSTTVTATSRQVTVTPGETSTTERTFESTTASVVTTITNNQTPTPTSTAFCPNTTVLGTNYSFSATLVGKFASSLEKCSNGRSIATGFCDFNGNWTVRSELLCEITSENILTSLENKTLTTKTETVFLISTEPNITDEVAAKVVSSLQTSVNVVNSTTQDQVKLVTGVLENLARNVDTSSSKTSVPQMLDVVTSFAFKQNIPSNSSSTLTSDTVAIVVKSVQKPEVNARVQVEVPAPTASDGNGAVVSSIDVPNEAFSGNASSFVRIVAVQVTNTEIFPPAPQNGTQKLTGSVVSINIGGGDGQQKVSNLQTPIKISWNVKKEIDRVRTARRQSSAHIDIGSLCTYYNNSLETFSTDGVEVAAESGTSSTQTCDTYHLTSFALFTKITFPPVPPTTSSIFGSSVAIGSLTVVAFLHVVFNRLRRDPFSNIILQTSLSAMAAFIVYLVASLEWGNLSRSVCLVLASLHHLFLLIAFAWLALAAFISHKNMDWPLKWVLKWAHCEQNERNYAMKKYSCIVYVPSILVFAVSVAVMMGLFENHTINDEGVAILHQNAYAGKASCLMQGATLQFWFAIPAGILYVFALFYAIRSTVRVTVKKDKTEVIFQGYRTQFLQSKHTAEHLFIFLVFFGLTWAVACARIVSDQFSLTYYHVLDHVYAACSIAVGVLAMLLFCLRAKHVRLLLTTVYHHVVPSGARYYLPRPNADGTYRGNVLAYQEHQRIGIELQDVGLPATTRATSTREAAETSLRSHSIAPRRPNSSIGATQTKLYDTSDDVAKDDLELSKGRLGLVGPSMSESSEAGPSYLD